MFNFPEGLYTDVRIEDTYETLIVIRDHQLEQNKNRKFKGAFIRIFDADKWYYSATTDLTKIQEEIDHLAKLASPKQDIKNHPIVAQFEVNRGTYITYDDPLSNQGLDEKLSLLKTYTVCIDDYKEVATWRANYIDTRKVKQIYSSKGTSLEFDTQHCGISINCSLDVEGKKFDTHFIKGSDTIASIKGLQEELKEEILSSIDYIQRAVPVEPGKYTVVLNPELTGVFTHESFGHKSESDLMLGSETMKEEWALGKRVGAKELTIIDQGTIKGSGYVPFDDEGNKAKINYIIKNGLLTGRLHSTATSIALGEALTGNARAMNFEYEPIVRMTTTYIAEGTQTKDELIENVEDGIYIVGCRHGSGMSTFTIAPSRAYRIRKGQVAEPVMISVITGNVMEALYDIDGISNEVEMLSFGGGGCGKMEQFPLPVGFGGPYIRVKNISVQ